MTSEAEALKTNEFLRRRKLRLQQVREQSKDIAKKIRQRAKVEKLRQVVDLDAKKQKEYFECQERLVKQLEVLYARGLDNVGAGHHSASELIQQDEVTKRDLSKVRGKEAAAELRRKKQEKLDLQKKILDRKLQAREVANEISREKTSTVANKQSKQSNFKVSDDSTEKAAGSSELAKETNKDVEKNNNELETVKTADMATQWDMDSMPHEWEPAVPALSLPTDKDTANDNEVYGSKPDKNKRLDLFALSKEMPSSLRGQQTHEHREREPGRPSLTIVSEYLQNRKLRLRENEPASVSKKSIDDMQSLKQTIQRTRSSKPEVPGKATPTDKFKSIQDMGVQKKSSVTMYNHSTRDSRDLPFGEDKFVIRDPLHEEDAYSQAMREVSALGVKDKDSLKKVQEMRSKVAVTKQNVEKEYKDTMNFLNALPKDKCSKTMKNAYMDERRQQMQQESRQQKMQQEYKKIEKECRKHNCLKSQSRHQSRTPSRHDTEDNFDSRDFQYSWMPVPESDGNLAIHAIPNTVKQGKSGNSVKFSTVDSYHEYRSRHKHTPPTKDIQDKPSKKVLETIMIDKEATESSDTSSVTSDTSSVINMKIDSNTKRKSSKEINQFPSAAEKIIIYKVLDSNEKKTKRQTKLLNEIAKSLTCIEKGQKLVSEDGVEQPQAQQPANVRPYSKSADNPASLEHLNEGVYKMVEEQGASYNMMSCCTTNVEMWHSTTPRKPWWDNIASMYFSDRDKLGVTQSEDSHIRTCQCKQHLKLQPSDNGSAAHWENADCPLTARPTSECTNANKPVSKPPTQASTAPSTSSYITANNEKGSNSEGGFIKLVDETGHEAGKFFIGAAGFLNNNTYEVVIQLRKKDGTPQENIIDVKTAINENKQDEVSNNNDDVQNNASSKTGVNNVQVTSDEDIREVLGYRSDHNKKSFLIPPDDTNSNSLSEELYDAVADKNENNQNETNTVPVDDLLLIQSNSVTKDMCDKGVHTHIPDTPKTQQAPKAATTTYTQTTSRSPIHRPVFFHMSSSTSTAYMSPPEMILPKFFRHNRGSDIVDSEVYDPIQGIELTAKEFCEEYAGCPCRKCLLARKVTQSKVPQCCRHENNKVTTPPNSNNNVSDLHHEAQEGVHHRNVPSNVERTVKPKCSHHKRRHAESIKRHCYRNKRPSIDSVHSSRNMALNLKNRYKSTSSNRDKKSESRLNPIIKDYVNKLLALNREGLKAVEVADQECSSVGTPGSSIINVPFNVDERKTSLLNTISLEQIKSLLKQQIMEEQLSKNFKNGSFIYTVGNSKNSLGYSPSRTSRKKPIHKVKSLNISKQLLRQHRVSEQKPKNAMTQLYAVRNVRTRVYRTVRKARSKSSPTPRHDSNEPPSRYNDSLSTANNSTVNCRSNRSGTTKSVSPDLEYNNPDAKGRSSQQLPLHRATATETTDASESVKKLKAYPKDIPVSMSTQKGYPNTTDIPVSMSTQKGYPNTTDIPVSMSTQTAQSKDVNTDCNFIKLAEDKLHNMEKIADLTEKCTKRLSNLAKVLQEVRKNKSLVYSQISSAESTDSQSDHKSEEVIVSPALFESNNNPQVQESKSPEPAPNNDYNVENEILQSGYITILSDISKPLLGLSESNIPPRPKSIDKLDSDLHLSATTAEMTIKSRPKPPPALSRLSFKHGQEYVVPHELSTVIEVDSPMSMKLKNQSSRNEPKDTSFNSNRSSPRDILIETENIRQRRTRKESNVNPDLLQTNSNFTNQYKLSSTESSDESKFQMIDLKHFNEIMLEPFISIQEYAKQYNMEPPDEGSNLDDIHREDANNDDMSSLHSDGSLPDVIAELLKRNIITEPFKFDTASNINSTTVSSESTLSMLALSKVRRDRKRSHVFHNKENIGETSDTMSMSSNPDLENAFKKLGMGWASSTLKKTKERLALSSSSNTSSSSLSQFKIKSFNQDVPVLVTDSVSSVAHVTKGVQHKNTLIDNSKSAEQQTTLSNSMTVKEFLRNELAKKITFTNKSNAHDTQEEFVSMFETKMPEEMKDTSQVNHDRSVDSGPSANRARTSTPVQLFKSVTYHSSSSSNVSNGLFSNADDLSSVKMTSNSMKNHSTSDKDDLTIPNFSLRMKKSSDCSKSD